MAQAHPELIGLVLRYRDQQQSKLRSKEIPLMLERLQTTPDYYIEMRWEVSSWGESLSLSLSLSLSVTGDFLLIAVPFLSRMCPSDTYKIWKKGEPSTLREEKTFRELQY